MLVPHLELNFTCPKCAANTSVHGFELYVYNEYECSCCNDHRHSVSVTCPECEAELYLICTDKTMEN